LQSCLYFSASIPGPKHGVEKHCPRLVLILLLAIPLTSSMLHYRSAHSFFLLIMQQDVACKLIRFLAHLSFPPSNSSTLEEFITTLSRPRIISASTLPFSSMEESLPDLVGRYPFPLSRLQRYVEFGSAFNPLFPTYCPLRRVLIVNSFKVLNGTAFLP